jgi:hypothetical protein
MSIQFDNKTPYEALRTDMLDQHGELFHAVIAKMSYRIEAGGLAEEPTATPLHTDDTPYGAPNQSSIQFESDLAPFKPRTDVIINATAYAPQGKAVHRFQARVRVGLADTPAPLPPEPEGLNQFRSASKEKLDKWRKDVERAKRQTIPGKQYIDKTLNMTGERHFAKRNIVFRLFDSLMLLSTLGLARSNPWALSAPTRIKQLPVRYEFAFGGQSRIEVNDPAAPNVPAKHCLTKEQIAKHPDQDNAPIAHVACESNPVGCGFIAGWYMKAKAPQQTPAPQIESPAAPVTADLFWAMLRGKAKPDDPALQPQGFGFVGRGWLPRRELVGPVEEKAEWREDEIPQLPPTFDFGYWNGAPRDQQTPHLAGNEIVELTNLCAPDHPAAGHDQHGNTVLRFRLPGDRLYLVLGDVAGRVGAKFMQPDTIVIDPEKSRVDVTWRVVVSARVKLAEMELRVNRANERDKLDVLWKAIQEGAQAEPTAHQEVAHG